MFKYFLLIVLLASMLINTGCEKDYDYSYEYPTYQSGDRSHGYIQLIAYDAKKVNVTTAFITGSIIISPEEASEWSGQGICYATHELPTIEDETHTCEKGTEYIYITLSSLKPNTRYYYKPYVILNGNVLYGTERTFKTYNTGAIMDIDSNYYNVVTVGSKVWMAENLRVTKLNNGSKIKSITSTYTWSFTTSAAMCYPGMDSAKHAITYGAYYNWYTINTNKLCPSGWHVPTQTEWEDLLTEAGGANDAGNALKEAGNSHWQVYNPDVTNSSGMSVLPATSIDEYGYLGQDFDYAYFWTSSLYPLSSQPAYVEITDVTSDVIIGKAKPKDGMSVRCIKD